MKVRVYTDYDPVRILRGVCGKQFIEPTDALAAKCNLSGNYTVLDDSLIPQSREDRKYWKVADGKVRCDHVRKQADLDKAAQIEADKMAILEKLKISKEDFAKLTESKKTL